MEALKWELHTMDILSPTKTKQIKTKPYRINQILSEGVWTQEKQRLFK